MKEEAIVARDLVDHLWKDAPDVHWRQPEPALATLPPSDHVVHRPDLAYLNRSWIWAPGPDATGLGEVPRSLRHRLKLWLARLIMQASHWVTWVIPTAINSLNLRESFPGR